ncbi:MAG: FumA C-terminus/TtdB family hydratase beta subunit [bacterium]
MRIGDRVSLSGTVVTARDIAHRYLVEKVPDIPELCSGVIYHCGPIVRKEQDRFIAAGPTTSIRQEMYQARVIKDYRLRGIIGKGGMGEETAQALIEGQAVYLHAIGGAAAYAAQKMQSIKKVYQLEEFGIPEALWVIEVKDFPLVVTMDSQGGNLHREVADRSKRILEEFIYD